MDAGDFVFHLPKELIAQEPASPRDTSRLLVLDRRNGNIRHCEFNDIPDLFDADDVMVVNDTKVLPARLFGRKRTGGKVEILLINALGDKKAMLDSELSLNEARWTGYVRGKNVRTGMEIALDGVPVQAVLGEHLGGTKFSISFTCEGEPTPPPHFQGGTGGPDCPRNDSNGTAEESLSLHGLLNRAGVMPTPPYIRKELENSSKYQTIFAEFPGSIAAPTAGLHFSDRILGELANKGVNIASITLHVGPGTFQPVSSDCIEKHRMEPEFYTITENCAELVNGSISKGGRLWVVGTTTMKTLETVYSRHGKIVPDHGNSDLFIHPPYEFRTPASFFITNFHLPRSTLIMMISAYAGREKVLAAYRQAVERRYRFYSFGDAMLITG